MSLSPAMQSEGHFNQRSMDTLGRRGSVPTLGCLNPHEYTIIYRGPTSPVGKILNFVHNVDSETPKQIDGGFQKFNYQCRLLKANKRGLEEVDPCGRGRKTSDRIDGGACEGSDFNVRERVTRPEAGFSHSMPMHPERERTVAERREEHSSPTQPRKVDF